jgi:hypothetical protein
MGEASQSRRKRISYSLQGSGDNCPFEQEWVWSGGNAE